MRPEDRGAIPLPDPVALEPPAGFVARASALGVSLDETTIEKLGAYLARLLAMNELMNLTAIADPIEAWERHVLDALTLIPLIAKLASGSRIVDVGSGGGVPGIPLAIVRADLQFTLVEATQKKAQFLGAVASALGLENVSVRSERAEDLTKSLGGTFDAVTARAVARLTRLLPLTAPFAKPGGMLLLIKGQRADEELKEASRLLRSQRVSHEKTLATPTGRIVVLRKS